MTEIIWTAPVQHVHRLTVGDTHIDMFGHANNAWYVAWAMDCAWGHSEALGLNFAAYERAGVGCVVREHRFEYLAPAHLGDGICVGTWIAENDGRLRLTRGFELRREKDGVLLVRGHTLFVSINLKSGRPARMPAAYINAYKPASVP